VREPVRLRCVCQGEAAMDAPPRLWTCTAHRDCFDTARLSYLSPPEFRMRRVLMAFRSVVMCLLAQGRAVMCASLRCLVCASVLVSTPAADSNQYTAC